MQEDDTEVQEAVEIVTTAKLMAEVVTAVATQVAAVSTPIPVAKLKTLTITAAPVRLEIVQDDDDDVFVEATTLAQKVLVVDYQVVVIDNKPKYKIIRADDTHQFYISFTTLLKNFDREDLETLWRISVHDLELVKRWKLLTSCGVHVSILLTVQLFLLVERRYPLLRFTLEQLVNVARLQVEEESEMFLELLRFTRQQLQEYQQG
nr:hypothetical protein [Tanacetum cinerariifolium]